MASFTVNHLNNMSDEEETKVLQDTFLKLWCYSSAYRHYGAYGYLLNTASNPSTSMSATNLWKKSSYITTSQVLDTQNMHQSTYNYQHLSLNRNEEIKQPLKAEDGRWKPPYFFQNVNNKMSHPYSLPYFSNGEEIRNNGSFSNQMIRREEPTPSYKYMQSRFNSKHTKQILPKPNNLLHNNNALKKVMKEPSKPSHKSTKCNMLQVSNHERVFNHQNLKSKEEERQRSLYVSPPTDHQTPNPFPCTPFPHQNFQTNQSDLPTKKHPSPDITEKDPEKKNGEEQNLYYEQTEPLDLSKHANVSVSTTGRTPHHNDNDNSINLTNSKCYINSINTKKNTGHSQSTNFLFSSLVQNDKINEENVKTNDDTNNNGYSNRKSVSNEKNKEKNDFLSRKIIEYNWSMKRKIQRKRFKIRNCLKKREFIKQKQVIEEDIGNRLEKNDDILASTTNAQSTQNQIKRILTDESVNKTKDQHMTNTENKSCFIPDTKCPSRKENMQESNIGKKDMLDELIPTKNAPQNIYTLSEEALTDGLRVLLRQDGLFYPGKLSNIVPPDIYGILVENDRGNKPHVLSREQVISQAILDIKPPTIKDLKLGTRVCAFWSSKMTCLHPGIIVGHELEEGFVIIQHDDGDCRDIHVDQVRYLPENYPLFEKKLSLAEAYPTLIMMRKMQNESIHTQTIKKTSRKTKDTGKARKSKCYTKENKLKTMPSKSKRTRKSNLKSSKQSFSPQPNRRWSWYDEGRKLSAKSQNVYHDTIEKDNMKLHVGDCAVFHSTERHDRPYIGRIQSMWETVAGNRKVRVRWFYHPAEVEGVAVGGRRVEQIKTKGALFESNHFDENYVSCISHPCQVLPLAEYKNRHENTCDLYYLAGDYDPVEGVIVFGQGVFD